MILVVRTECNAKVGAGHATRCLAIAEAWMQRGGKVFFLTSCRSSILEQEQIEDKLSVESLEVTVNLEDDVKKTLSYIEGVNADWVVLDGYDFSSSYQKALKKRRGSLLVLDDFVQADHYYADLVLNQSAQITEEMYSNREPYTEYLIGTRYVLLREGFRKWRKKQPESTSVKNILVTFGCSGDAGDLVFKVLKAIQQVKDHKDLNIVVVQGGQMRISDQCYVLMEEMECFIELRNYVKNMPELMNWADVAFSAGGVTLMELVFIGVPTIVVQTADNQRYNIETLQRQDAVCGMGSGEIISMAGLTEAFLKVSRSSEQRKKMMVRGHLTIDGKGSERVVSVMEQKMFGKKGSLQR